MSQIKIERLALGGSGVGKIDGKVCFVSYALPSDLLDVEIVEDKKSFLTAKIKEIIEPSPIRINPSCKHFTLCGGCSFQNISYEEELNQKDLIFQDTLLRIGGITSGIKNIVPSQEPKNYRTRAQFKVKVENKRLKIGFYEEGSHKIEDLPEGCPLLLDKINVTLLKLRETLESFKAKEFITDIFFEATSKGDLVITISLIKQGDNLRTSLEKCGFTAIATVVIKEKNKASTSLGNKKLTYSLKSKFKEYELSYYSGGFSQINELQNQNILSIIEENISEKVESIVDLYSGNANFTIPLSSYCKEITAVEVSNGSCISAKENIEKNNVTNCTVVNLDTSKFKLKKCEILLLDPPRSGAKEVIPEILRVLPEKIFYVSCNPSTLARDIKMLKENYNIASITPVDMFPRTHHIEAVAVLSKGERFGHF